MKYKENKVFEKIYSNLYNIVTKTHNFINLRYLKPYRDAKIEQKVQPKLASVIKLKKRAVKSSVRYLSQFMLFLENQDKGALTNDVIQNTIFRPPPSPLSSFTNPELFFKYFH